MWQPWVHDSIADGTPLLDAVKAHRPTCLLGLSTVKDVFSEEVVREVASFCSHPIIMPMSNPTSKSECTPEQAYTWTDGRAIVATGSPFKPVSLPDGRTLVPSQCNNMCVTPPPRNTLTAPLSLPPLALRADPTPRRRLT